MLPQAAIVLEPPEPRARKDDEGGAARPKLLELLDRLGARSRVMPEVIAGGRLREVAGGSADVEERGIAPADDQHLLAVRNELLDKLLHHRGALPALDVAGQAIALDHELLHPSTLAAQLDAQRPQLGALAGRREQLPVPG